MSDTYTKLFSSITESTIVSEPVATRWLWVTMLAMANGQGEVFGSIPGLARRANLTLEETERGLATFFAPDPYSRTKENEGRRVEEIKDGGGWILINHAKYRAIRSADERREYMREYMREKRSKDAEPEKELLADSLTPLAMSTNVTPPKPTPTLEKKRSKELAPPENPATPAVLTLPLNDGTEFPITAEQVREFSDLYPAVDVIQSLRAMRGWCVTNPTNRKTRAGIMRFVNRWLAKEQDDGGARGPNRENSTSSRKLSAVDRVVDAIAQRRREREQQEPIQGEIIR